MALVRRFLVSARVGARCASDDGHRAESDKSERFVDKEHSLSPSLPAQSFEDHPTAFKAKETSD
ncbi:hypothetical protein CUJ88_25200 [Paraburkholderia hospita]|uniref:Uncharacterized protein n=1 Tax=Paraburkholderia hospita TaxID=169430 RepID=A0AAN1JC32_9BURK|nr:hypothetical protein C2L64_23270 [Paraburkholderia hospita]AXF01727.1 hypothetical protein CUJ88_25200 [Paraburkholderia hospita]OUL75435.1 hypothetical protein CA602_36490 [Paraburkholderia hospita]